SEHVTTALKLISSGEDRINKFKKLEYGSLKIGVGDTAARFFLPKEQGKIKHIGITSHNLNTIEKAIEDGKFDTIQFPYNIVEGQA
ncbi:hypothetical protein ACTPD5_21440, partial [Clostridioides difficile]